MLKDLYKSRVGYIVKVVFLLALSIASDKKPSDQNPSFSTGYNKLLRRRVYKIFNMTRVNPIPHMLYLEHCIISINNLNFQIFYKK